MRAGVDTAQAFATDVAKSECTRPFPRVFGEHNIVEAFPNAFIRVTLAEAKELVEEGLVTAVEVEAMRRAFQDKLESELKVSDGYKPNKADWLDGKWSGLGRAEEGDRRGETAVAIETLKALGKALTTTPKEFHLHKGVERVRKNMPLGEIPQPIDCANAAIFLVSDAAAQITGQVLHVNGGLIMP